MTVNLLDWDEDLQVSPDEEYRALLNGLRRTKGFGLFFVQCSPFSGGKLIERVQADLTEKTIGVLKFEHAITDGNVFKRVSEFLAKFPADVLFIQGLENSLFDAEETKKRMDWIDEKVHAYTWREVPPVLINLNQQRERFRDSFATCFVFLLPQYAINYIVHRAPDFFDWRSGLVNYVSDLETLEKESKRILAEEADYQAYCKWSSDERKSRIFLIQCFLDESRIQNQERARFYFEQGLLFSASGDNEVAISNYDKAINLKPDHFDAFRGKGGSLHDLGHIELAINHYDLALKINPQDHKSLYNKGLALSDLGCKQEAIACYDDALALKPDLHVALFNKGNALSDLGRQLKEQGNEEEALAKLSEGIACYDNALALKPDLHVALFNKGLALSALGRKQEAIACYDDALALKPDKYEALFNKGLALYDLGRKQEAIACYDDALAIKPDLHEALYNKGTALYALGRLDAAIACYDTALALKADFHEALFNKALCCAQLGDLESGVNALQQAVTLNPQYRQTAKQAWEFAPIRHDERFRALLEGE